MLTPSQLYIYLVAFQNILIYAFLRTCQQYFVSIMLEPASSKSSKIFFHQKFFVPLQVGYFCLTTHLDVWLDRHYLIIQIDLLLDQVKKLTKQLLLLGRKYVNILTCLFPHLRKKSFQKSKLLPLRCQAISSLQVLLNLSFSLFY